ncbi:metallophosphoesterase [bacterium]|nr:metallophosphoesterase [bacterium]
MNTLKKLTWLSDIHLDFLKENSREVFYNQVKETNSDAILISGDIGTSNCIETVLLEMKSKFKCPIYFVLGNHDYFGSSIEMVRTQMKILTKNIKELFWMPETGVVPLTESFALIGHGGWADGGFGDFINSNVNLYDYSSIKELTGLTKRILLNRLNTTALDATSSIMESLELALFQFDNVIMITHVPPFEESCIYKNSTSDINWVPHFASKVMGLMLNSVMEKFPSKKLTVLCGHTHGNEVTNIEPLKTKISPNIIVKTANAVYKTPHIQEIIHVT